MPELSPGLYRDWDFETYRSVPALNSGVISRWGDVSMLHVHEALAGRIDSIDTPDRKFGRAVHMRLLEPERYASEILVATGCSAQKKKGDMCTNAGTWFDGKFWTCGVHRTDDCTQPADYVNADEAARIEAMAARLHNHPALGLLKRKGWSELSGLYERNGVLCKFRSDRVPEEMDLVIDIKKTQLGKATDWDCIKAIEANSYFVQAAMNVDGIKAHHPMNMEPLFVWVFIEDSHPHGVNVVVASDEMIQDGRDVIDMTLLQYKRCQAMGVFHDYMPDGTKPFVARLSDWKHKQIQQRKAVLTP